MQQWEQDGYDQAVKESRKRIKRAWDHWNRLYQGLTGDCDVSDADYGEERVIKH